MDQNSQSCNSAEKIKPARDAETQNADFKTFRNAIISDNYELAKRSIETLTSDSSIDSRDSEGQTFLHIAAEYGHTRLVRLLINKGADVNLPDTKGETPLLLLLKNEEIPSDRKKRVINLLCENGADPLIANYEELTPLQAAVQFEKDALITLLTNFLSKRKDHLNLQDTKGFTPLTLTISSTNMGTKAKIDIISILCESGADPRIPNKLGQTPLHLAVQSQNYKVVARLIAHLKRCEADFNSRNTEGFTPLELAIFYQNVSIAALLHQNGANPHIPNKLGQSLLHLAVQSQNYKVVESLLQHFCLKQDLKDAEGFTPLALAALYGNTPIVELLFQNGGDPHEPTALGNTPLHIAVKSENYELAILLIDLRARIDDQDYAGRTPLFWAIIKNNIAIVKLLCEKGADLHKLDQFNQTPFQLALQSRNYELLEFIIGPKPAIELLNAQTCPPSFAGVNNQAFPIQNNCGNSPLTQPLWKSSVESENDQKRLSSIIDALNTSSIPEYAEEMIHRLNALIQEGVPTMQGEKDLLKKIEKFQYFQFVYEFRQFCINNASKTLQKYTQYMFQDSPPSIDQIQLYLRIQSRLLAWKKSFLSLHQAFEKQRKELYAKKDILLSHLFFKLMLQLQLTQHLREGLKDYNPHNKGSIDLPKAFEVNNNKPNIDNAHRRATRYPRSFQALTHAGEKDQIKFIQETLFYKNKEEAPCEEDISLNFFACLENIKDQEQPEITSYFISHWYQILNNYLEKTLPPELASKLRPVYTQVAAKALGLEEDLENTWKRPLNP